MLSSLASWLGKIDPNVAVPLIVSALAFLYHQLFSASAQAKIASAINDAMELAQKAIDAGLALAPAGTTAAQLEADLWNVAKAQLQHAGLDPSKLPPVVQALLTDLINVAVAKWKAMQPAAPPQPQAVPIVAVPPPVPAGAAKGSGRVGLVCALAFGTALAVGIAGATATELSGCGSTVGQVALKTGQCVLDSGVLTQVENALLEANYAGAVAQLATTVAPTLITCALQAIAAGQAAPSTPNDAGVAPAALAAGDPRPGRAKELLDNPSLWQKAPAK